MADVQSYDLAVVGTGFHGLSVAKTYLDLHPSASIVLFDNGPTPGGVWSADRLYPGLKTNNRFRKYEFGDYAMDGEGLRDDQHIPGKIVHKYLCSYAENFDLVSRTQFSTKVETAEQIGEKGWLLTVGSASEPTAPRRKVHAARLVVAAGLTSEARTPSFDGMEDFKAPFLHAKEYATIAESLRGAKRVTILGAGKSGWDVAYSFASAGVQVDWVISKHGHGPCWMGRRNIMGPLKVVSERLISTRIVTWLSPCIWGEADGYKRTRVFLNHTWMGRKIIDGFASLMQHGSIHDSGYNNHPETKKLIPWCSPFWIGSNRGLMNFDGDILQLVRDGKIRVHIEEVAHLTDHTVHLSDGTQLATDAFICCTGWKHALPMKFLRDGKDISAELGLPHPSPSPETVNPLVQRADAEIFSSFPRLKDQPQINNPLRPLNAHVSETRQSSETTEPYRLYRFMVPPRYVQSRTIAFAGVARNASTAWLAQVQALWITAFFAGKLSHLARSGKEFTDEIEYEAMLHSRFGRWRYPLGFGRYFPDFFFDALPYVDLMMRELGLDFKRKNSWFSDVFEAYGPSDYTHITEEWFASQRRKESEERELQPHGKRGVRGVDRVFRQLRGLAKTVDATFVGQSFVALMARVAGFLLLLSVVTSGVLSVRL